MNHLRFVLLGLMFAVAGCQLIVDFDRSLIPDASSSDAGTSDAGGDASSSDDAG